MSDAVHDPFAEVQPVLERTLLVHSPIDRVWLLVHDPCRLAEWSPTVHHTRFESATGAEPGARFVNLNRDGELEWTTHGAITRLEAPNVVAFRIEENWAVWSFELEARGEDTTQLTQRRETPEGISQLSRELTDAFMGGQRAFTDSLIRGMDETLRRIKSAAEAGAVEEQSV